MRRSWFSAWRCWDWRERAVWSEREAGVGLCAYGGGFREFLHLRDTVAVQCLELLIGDTNARLV